MVTFEKYSLSRRRNEPTVCSGRRWDPNHWESNPRPLDVYEVAGKPRQNISKIQNAGRIVKEEKEPSPNMKNLHIYSIFVASLISVAAAYTVPNSDSANKAAVTSGGNRRAFLSSMANAAVIASSAASNPSRAIAADNQEDVYFGAGCFWHVQHEFISAERNLLGRKDNEMTSLTGYAGGMKTGSEGRVCYHNFQSVADYGKLGHGEVVGVTIPQSSVGGEFFSWCIIIWYLYCISCS